MGRFLSVDPVTFIETGEPGMFNRYAYAGNDPINKIDPDGETPVHAAAAALAGSAAVGAGIGIATEALVIEIQGGNSLDFEANKGRYALAAGVCAVSGGVGGTAVKEAVALAPNLIGKSKIGQGVVAGLTGGAAGDATDQLIGNPNVSELKGGDLAKSALAGAVSGALLSKLSTSAQTAGNRAQGLGNPNTNSGLTSGQNGSGVSPLSTTHSNSGLATTAGTTGAIAVNTAQRTLD